MKNRSSIRKTINLWIVLAVVAVLVGGFLLVYNRLTKQKTALEAELYQVNSELSDAQNRQGDLKEELNNTTTDAYIENVARTEYGYMSKDEIRIVIDNPEALYEDGQVPER